MLSKTHVGFQVPISELPIPVGYFQSLSEPIQKAFLVALSSVTSNYVEYRRQSINMDQVPEEDGTVSIASILRVLLRQQDLSLLDPLMILPAVIFSGLDEYLDRRALAFEPNTKIALQHLSSSGVPTIKYEPDRWIEVTWRG